MRWLAAIVFLWLGAAAARAETSPLAPTSLAPTSLAPPFLANDPVAYRLSPVFQGQALSALEVQIRFREGPSGQTRLAWIRSWGGEERLWRTARDMKIEGGEATPDGPGGWIVRAAPGTPIVATYRIVSAYDHDPTASDSRQAWPVIRPGWFFAVGEALFAEPEDHDKAPATFQWIGTQGLGFASDLEHLAGPGRKATRPGTVDDILESVVIGGKDLRLIEQRADGARLRVALVGHYGFADRAFAHEVFDVLKTERGFWKEPAGPYLVAMSPIASEPQRYSVSGAGRSDAFALWVDPSSGQANLRWLLAHEYFHTWNPIQLGSLPDGPTEPLGYWFSEGFTDYFAWKLMLAGGQFGPADFAARWNETLKNYALSPLKAAPNSVVMTNFWVNQDAQKLPYYRGAILAAVLDVQARTRGSSLDAVLREMRRMAGVNGETRHAPELFARAYEAVTGLDPRPLIQRHMIEGEPVALPQAAFGGCFAVKTLQVAAFDRGWDLDATRAAGMTLAGVKADSPAYAAGLRNGMRILELISTTPGDATRPYVLKVKAAGEADQVISYLPAGAGTIERQAVTPVEAPGCPPLAAR